MLSRKKIEDFVFKMKEWKASSMVGGAKICLTQLLYNELDKVTLIRSIVQTIPSHTISTFELPILLYNRLDKVTRMF